MTGSYVAEPFPPSPSFIYAHEYAADFVVGNAGRGRRNVRRPYFHYAYYYARNRCPATVYDFTVKSIDGKDVKLSQYKGKKLLIVNTASKCGFTPQYAELEELSKKYTGKIVVLGFPSDSFNQELGSNAEVAAFCQKNFGVTFPLFSTVPVKGADAAPAL